MSGLLMSSKGAERDQWHEIGQRDILTKNQNHLKLSVIKI